LQQRLYMHLHKDFIKVFECIKMASTFMHSKMITSGK
jgi:mevalonate pyrophosphate decarboxylase